MRKHFVIVDTDAGTDDALALFIVLKAHSDPKADLELVAITCTHGNTTVDNVTRNVRKVLSVSQTKEAKKVPVFRGAESPLVLPFSHLVEQYHGQDGFGDVDQEDWDAYLSRELSSVDLHPENAANAIIEFAHEHKGNISILALGPLTNLALAVRLDPGIKDCFKSIICMGGNIEGVGNCTMSAEFNFGLDPEAAFIVLDTFKCPITIAPWETCKREAKSIDWRIDVLGKVGTSKSSLLNLVEGKILNVWPTWIPCDQIAAAVLVSPQVVLDSKAMHCTVELQGLHTRGMMVMDHIGIQKESNNVTLITKIDSSLFEQIMIDALQ